MFHYSSKVITIISKKSLIVFEHMFLRFEYMTIKLKGKSCYKCQTTANCEGGVGRNTRIAIIYVIYIDI